MTSPLTLTVLEALNGAKLMGPITATDIDAATLDVSGAATIGGLLTTNGQIAFPAIQNPSTNPNVLDDYEEGVWTPSFAFGGASVGMTFASRSGTYVKIGKIVHIIGQINLSAMGSSTGNATVTGLPFTVGANAGCSVGLYLGFQASVTGVTAIFLNSTTTMNLYNLGAGSQVQLTQANFGAGSVAIFGGSYSVA